MRLASRPWMALTFKYPKDKYLISVSGKGDDRINEGQDKEKRMIVENRPDFSLEKTVQVVSKRYTDPLGTGSTMHMANETRFVAATSGSEGDGILQVFEVILALCGTQAAC